MNVRRFGTILLVIAAVVLAAGAFMWMTGVPDDGRYHVEASNVFELMAKNRALIERRRSARMPLMLGGIGVVIAAALIVSARAAASPKGAP
ncbi:MAG TPA: hypothetical protein VE974_25630 [Thermoanaerobaculia bacterium]|nr:hypothetical protein [Thermoanaerobaculia bacterium]